MEIEINSENLFDSPYKEDKDALFSFNDESLNDLADDLCCGNRTCYLVSGYRGVGKSSFINKLELLSQTRKKEKESICFVNVSFAKYNSQSFLIRKLLRQLFIKTTSQKIINKSTTEGKKVHELLEHLHKQTFHQIRQQVISETKEEKFFSIALNYRFVVDLLNLILPALAFILIKSGLNTSFPELTNSILLVWLILSLISISWHYSITETDSNKTSSETLYDEEIAGYHFLDVPLANPGDLRSFFYKHLIVPGHSLTKDQQDELDRFLDQVIFESRLIHRRFISLIRQHSVWKGGHCIMTAKTSNPQIPYGEILNSLTELRSSTIAADGLDAGIKDFMLMTVYIHISKRLQEHAVTNYLK